MVQEGRINRDEHQLAALAHLDGLWRELVETGYEPPEPTLTTNRDEGSDEGGLGATLGGLARGWGIALGGGSENPSGAGGVKVSKFGAPKEEESSGGGWWPFGGGGESASKAAAAEAPVMRPPPGAPRGLYLHGGVGTGKTYVMDLFFDCVPVEQKRRVHFNKFMLDVHARLHRLRPAARADASLASGVGRAASGALDPMEVVTAELLDEGWLLCFDEFQVTDIADALILKRLFEALLAKGAVVVATSNRPPDDLYRNGLQRALFLPFIGMVKELLTVASFEASRTDYRLVKGADQAEDCYFLAQPAGAAPATAAGGAAAADAAAREGFEALWRRLLGPAPMVSSTLRLTPALLHPAPPVSPNRYTPCEQHASPHPCSAAPPPP